MTDHDTLQEVPSSHRSADRRPSDYFSCSMSRRIDSSRGKQLSKAALRTFQKLRSTFQLLVIAEDKEKDTIDHERKIFDSWCGLIGFGIPTVGLKNDGLRDAVEGQPNQRSINQYILDENGLSSPYLEAIRQAFDRCHKGKSVDILYYEETLEPIQLRVCNNLYHFFQVYN